MTTAVCFALLCLRLYLERNSVRRNAARIPVRIAITGTRGKSTVTRMIAAALKEAGFSVLAKTTGSKAVIIRPDGREDEIVRRGLPSILEQKGILKEAAGLGVRAVVVEMMSIRPECLAVESGRVLRPHWLVITNARLDHREEMGWTKQEIARSLASAIRPGMTVLLPEDERHPEFERAAERAGATIVLVEHPKDGSPFDADRRLAEAVAPLRAFATIAKGSLVVLHAPPEVKANVDVWGPVGEALPLMRGLKQQFDPGRILNPGRFVGGL